MNNDSVWIWIFMLLVAFVIFFYSWPIILAALLIYIIYRATRHYRMKKYFESDEFKNHKLELENTVKDYNEIANYVREIPNANVFKPKEDKLENSNLATYENTSKHNYQRNRNEITHSNTTYNCSLQIVRKASKEPIKYLCKYFDIKAKQSNVNQLQEIDDNISRMENTITNLNSRRYDLENRLNPPKFILKYYKKELMDQIGIDIPRITLKYAQYTFEYVSAGGNSSQKTKITFDSRTVHEVSKYLVNRIKYSETAAAQRALMTKKLRKDIIKRDDSTCQNCGASTREQSLLLLEVDHIIPVSKGGTSTEDNLQTLCWKCNRSKSNKLIAE